MIIKSLKMIIVKCEDPYRGMPYELAISFTFPRKNASDSACQMSSSVKSKILGLNESPSPKTWNRLSFAFSVRL